MSGRAAWVRAFGSLACAGVLLLCAGACAASLPRPQYPLRSPQKALERELATRSPVRALRAEARVDQRAKQGRIRGTVLMFVERTGRVRFDVMTQFGPVAILTSDGQSFAYADFRENRFLVGEACPRNIARLLGVPLSAHDTARFLLGGTPVIDYASATLELTDDGYYRVSLRGKSGQRQRIDLAVYPSDVRVPPERQRLYLLRSELFGPSGAWVWRVTYDKAEGRKAGGQTVLMPRRVRIEQAAGASDTLVTFKEMTLNPTIPEEAFKQTPRPSMVEERVECE